MRTCFIMICAFVYGIANAQSLQWTKKYGTLRAQEQGNDIVLDNCNNIYTIGYAINSGTVSFDTISAQFNKDLTLVVTKHDLNGKTKWVKKAEGNTYLAKTIGYAITVDDSCNVYIAGGWWNGTINFEGIQLSGNEGTFIAKLNEQGRIIWIKQNNAKLFYNTYMSLSITKGGDLYLASNFLGNVSFDGSTNVSSIAGSTDICILKYTKDGILKWAKTFGGSGTDLGTGITTDSTGNIYCTGPFQGYAYFGTTSLSSSGYQNIFIIKCDTSGNVLWAKKFGSKGDEESYDIAIDSHSNLYLAGKAGKGALFLKYDTNGNLSWSDITSTGSNYGCISYGVNVDNKGGVYFTGTFPENMIIGTNSFDHGSFNDLFLAKYNNLGQFTWATTYQGAYTDIGRKLAIKNNNIYVIGEGSERYATADNDYLLLKFQNNSKEFTILSQPISTFACNGEGIATFSVKVTGSGPFTFNWKENDISLYSGSFYKGASTATLTIINPNMSFNGKKYYCTISNGINTINTNTITLSVDSVIADAGTNQLICKGNSTQLNATGGVNYFWFPMTGLNSTIGASVNASPTTSTSYSVIVTDTNGCKGKASVMITIPNMLVLSAGADVTICKGLSTVLNASGGGGNYTWSPAEGLSNTSIPNPMANPAITTTYSLTALSDCPVITSFIKIYVTSIPTIIISAPISICSGNSAKLSVSGALSYFWSPSTGLNQSTGNNIIANPVKNTIYSITGIGSNGCAKINTLNITVFPLPTITVIGIPTICIGDTTSLKAIGSIDYTWSPTTGINSTFSAIVIADPTVTTSYTITGTSNGCSATTKFILTVNSCDNNNTSIQETTLEQSVLIFPNPSYGVIYIDFKSVNTTNAIVKVIDCQGQVIYITNIQPFKNDYAFNINTNEQSKGVYFLQIIIDNQSITKKIFID